jgi:hypothetical protein
MEALQFCAGRGSLLIHAWDSQGVVVDVGDCGWDRGTRHSRGPSVQSPNVLERTAKALEEVMAEECQS